MMSSSLDKNKRSRVVWGRCLWCVSCVKWIPVLLIVVIVLWSYYAYVYQLCLLTVNTLAEQVIYLIVYHILFAIFIWAYWQTIFTDIGRVPSQFKIPSSEVEKLADAETEEAQRQILERFAQNLPVTNRTLTGAVRYCHKCQHVKPDRAHHCSMCGECVLKMDHHCPWVNNCVSFTNYKFFILFLGYALLYCIFIALTSLKYFIGFWRGDLREIGRFHILFLFFVSVMFAVSLVSLFGYHCYLVLHNRSTLEAFRAPVFVAGPDKDGFSLGKFNNFQEVFGDNRRTWFLPIFTSLGDGVVYPVRAQHQPSSYNSMGSTQTSLGDGVSFPQRLLDEDRDLLLGGAPGVIGWDEVSTTPRIAMTTGASIAVTINDDDDEDEELVNPRRNGQGAPLTAVGPTVGRSSWREHQSHVQFS